MNRGRGEFGPPCGPPGSPLPRHRAAASKPNRLRRSFRQTQAAAGVASPESRRADFKTPTRIPRSRAAGGFCGESPHNDSDVQQDIIWDATSPSPNRLGKRGKKQPVGVVDISEIVSRIAPKHGRPKVSEPTLQQWIGDSAAIPCTPVQVPKPKKKSPRPNGVDDLLKLAKQFDFNMFHQDEEEVEDLHQQSPELLSEDFLDLENVDESDLSPSLPPPGVKAAVGTDQQMEDDLDFLFDGPTQHVSGDLSQVLSAQPPQVKPASSVSSREAPGKPSVPSHGSTSGASTTNVKGASANDEFEDDWENDDLLNDSLMLEMTQNPQNFTAPKHCSTQKPASEMKYPVKVPGSGGVGLGKSAVSKVENVTQRTAFKLESNPDLSFKRVQTDTWTNSKVDYSSKKAGTDTQQNRFSSGEGALVTAGSQRTVQTSNMVKSNPPKPQFHQRTSVVSAATEMAQSFPQRPDVVSSCSEAPAVSDLLDEDLYSFFSSDPVWDDPADDDLLCEMCEDLENQIQSVSTKQALPAGPISSQRAALQPANRTWDNRTQQAASQKPFPQKQTLPRASGRPAGSSLAGGFTSNTAAGVHMNTVTDSFRSAQAKNILGSTNSPTCVQGGGVQSVPQGNTRKDQFTFKKPSKPVSTVTNTVLGKCSAAEIKLKKQQAMERRRQRLQATQNLRAPT